MILPHLGKFALMYVNNGIACEEEALDFLIRGLIRNTKNVNYELKPALLGKNDLLKISTIFIKPPLP